ncbi:Tfp pilus assembly protein PilF [Sphingosinicella microcystinivorans]|uniref:Tfp pilus assembly protein PilF n=1 Tax=Sphingosinicella microcystinivorans TaxID=335406 RepID=A0ABX9T3C0_SPHMI|nr:Tfp pilus assembly protein PilF [Sphingosinicella microcystinivorans]
MADAVNALRRNDLRGAEALIRKRLATDPQDLEAARLLAGVAAMTGSSADAEALLRGAIARAPAFVLAYSDLVSLLCRLDRAEEAIALLDNVIEDPSRRLWAMSLKTTLLAGERRIEEALHIHEQLIAHAPGAAVPWMNYGLALRTAGRLHDAVAAYRRSLEIDAANGFAWLGLANLRTIRLGSDDVALLERALETVHDDAQRIQLHFALGKALGDLNQFERSFRQYQMANDIRGRLVPYRAVDGDVREAEAAFTPKFFAERVDRDMGDSEAIFIVGMPRSGSTLIEQILDSHPLVEGLGELFELQNIVTRVIGTTPQDVWYETMANLTADERRALGQSYLNSVRRHRKTDRPFFTDKMPSNWQYLGLIYLILPNAKIIDARRHPVACCFSNFTTYFNLQTNVPTSLEELAHHYCSYTRMISHFDATLPGRIHPVQYERLIDDIEGEVRRLLAHLGLPFENACLRFHENPRAVDTPSSEQVRIPINRKGLGRWQNYEPWLAPLQMELGSLIETYSHSGSEDGETRL